MGSRGGRSHAGGGGHPDRNGIPLSLANYEQYEQQWIQNNFRSLTAAQQRYISEQLGRLFAAHDFGMDIRSEYLENVIAEGFKNQFETHTSQGSLDFSGRRQATEQLFGSDVRHMRPADFERYGYLVSRNVAAYNSSGYGDTTVRFKRDRVINRLTYTTDDSLYPAAIEETIAGRVSTNSIAGIWMDGMSADELVRRVQNSEGDVGDVREWLRGVTHGAYLELQYHGALTIDDVESINFRFEPPSQELLHKLRAKGVKVYYRGNPY